MKDLDKKIQEYLPKAKKYYSEVKKYYENLSLKEAVEKAAKAQVPISCVGKRITFADHQHRVGKENCERAAKELLKKERLKDLENAKTFEAIFNVTEEVRKLSNTIRLGNLWSYDTAHRIGFNRGIKPHEVFLQTGAKKGAYELAKKGKVNVKNLRGKRHVPPDIFPNVLANLEPYLIENILCVGMGEGWFN